MSVLYVDDDSCTSEDEVCSSGTILSNLHTIKDEGKGTMEEHTLFANINDMIITTRGVGPVLSRSSTYFSEIEITPKSQTPQTSPNDIITLHSGQIVMVWSLFCPVIIVGFASTNPGDPSKWKICVREQSPEEKFSVVRRSTFVHPNKKATNAIPRQQKQPVRMKLMSIIHIFSNSVVKSLEEQPDLAIQWCITKKNPFEPGTESTDASPSEKKKETMPSIVKVESAPSPVVENVPSASIESKMEYLLAEYKKTLEVFSNSMKTIIDRIEENNRKQLEVFQETLKVFVASQRESEHSVQKRVLDLPSNTQPS